MATNIAIVGAGCAGLGAATTFMEKGGDVVVTLIDANNWIGGRARTSIVPGLPVDLGPQFIQDPDINPWKGIMEGMPGYQGLKIEPIAMDSRYRAHLADDSWQTIIGNKGIDKMHNQLDSYYAKASELANCPIMTGNAPAFCEGQQDMRLALGASGYGAIAESAEPWQYLVTDNARQEDIPSKGNIYVPGGLGALVQNYGLLLISGNLKRLSFENATIAGIDGSNPEQLTLWKDSKESSVYDYCIVTVPAGQIGNIKLNPPLPSEQAKANDYIKLGSYKKVAFRPTKFPDDGANAIKTRCEYYLYDEENDGVWQYFRLPTDECILICVTAGDFARTLDGLADGDVAAGIIKLLGQAHPSGNFQPRQGAVVVTNWTNTPHIGGAYSYTQYDNTLSFDNETPYDARPKLATPLGRIYFAGEATWTKAYGTIHGAFLSGQQAAEAILKVMRG